LSNLFKLNLSQIESGNSILGQVLKWNGVQWAPGNDIGSSTNTFNLMGDVVGVSNSNIVTKIQNRPISSVFPIAGQVLKWNGSQWEPNNDNISSGGNNYWISSGNDIINNNLGSTFIRNRLSVLNDFNSSVVNLNPSERNNGRISVIDSRNQYRGFVGFSTDDTPVIGIGNISENILRAGFIIANGRYNLFAETKSFVLNHPTINNKVIVYSCIEGPELAAYERGTGNLINGKAEIKFSNEFELIINPSTLTITLTPISIDSKGLAVIEKNESGFKVGECLKGTGNYLFDWEVKGVRKGYEDYKVIRNKSDFHIDTSEAKIRD